MSDQQLPQALHAEGYSIARQVMDDVVARFLPNGGPAVARAEVTKVAEVLIRVYDDGKAAYDAVLERIRQYETAEHEAEERKWQQMMMSAVLNVMPKNGSDKQSSANGVGHDGAETGNVVLPPKLSTRKAMLIWQRLQQAGYIDEHYQPVRLSRTQLALLANDMGTFLGIHDKWKTFERLWNKNNLRVELYDALEQRKTLAFRGELKKIFADVQRIT